MMRDDHFITRSSGGSAEIDIIMYVELFSWSFNRFNLMANNISCNSNKYIKIFSLTKRVLLLLV